MLSWTVVYFMHQKAVEAYPFENGQLTEGINTAGTAPLSFSSSSLELERRELWEIVRGCFATIIAFTWIAVHPNVPAQDDGWFGVLRRRLLLMLCAAAAPEVVMIWAMRQWQSSRSIAMRHAERGWTQSHGFFVEMGGFMLCDTAGQDLYTLTIERMERLHSEGKIEWPTITEKQILDKSKADALSKALVVFQTTWFAVQVIVRGLKGLAITELEIVTVGYAMFNGLMYFFWWHKPLNVECAVYVVLISSGREAEGVSPIGHAKVNIPSESDGDLSLKSEDAAPRVRSSGDSEIESAESSRLKARCNSPSRSTLRNQPPSWNGQPLPPSPPHRSHHLSSFPHFIVDRLASAFIALHDSALCPLVGATARSPSASADANEDTLRTVPIFYVTESLGGSGAAVFISLMNATLGTVFGALHCVAWRFQFPSSAEQTLWKSGSVVIASTPAVLFSVVTAAWYGQTRGGVEHRSRFSIALRVVGNTAVLLYVASRLLLMTQAVVSLRALPDDAYMSVKWARYIPHL